jgi:hypothetical protein
MAVADSIPLQLRIDLAEAAIECAKALHDAIDPHSFDKRAERAERYAAIDLMLEAVLPLYLERSYETAS